MLLIPSHGNFQRHFPKNRHSQVTGCAKGKTVWVCSLFSLCRDNVFLSWCSPPTHGSLNQDEQITALSRTWELWQRVSVIWLSFPSECRCPWWHHVALGGAAAGRFTARTWWAEHFVGALLASKVWVVWFTETSSIDYIAHHWTFFRNSSFCSLSLKPVQMESVTLNNA